MVAIGFERIKYKIYGLVLLLVIMLIIGLCAVGYNESFTPVSMVYVRAERAGLQMYPGNRVQMRGVDVGKVGSIRTNGGGGVEIALKIQPEKLDAIPANVTAKLSQLTAFGAKTVSLTEPKVPAQERLRPNTVLQTHDNTVEVNNLLEKLTGVLNTAQPAKINAVLGGLAQAVDGRGDQIGNTARKLADYLRRFNANLPALQQDFRKTGQVSDVYAQVTPDLAALLQNARFTSRTVVNQRADLDSFLYQLTQFSRTGNNFFKANGDQLESLSANALPTSGLLKRYSPEFTCFFKGSAESDRRLGTFSGKDVPGIVANVGVDYGGKPYRYPENLPVIGANNGPDCDGLPDVHGDEIPPGLTKHVDKGRAPNDYPDPGSNAAHVGDQPVAAQLFGPLATLPALPPEQKNQGGAHAGHREEGR